MVVIGNVKALMAFVISVAPGIALQAMQTEVRSEGQSDVRPVVVGLVSLETIEQSEAIETLKISIMRNDEEWAALAHLRKQPGKEQAKQERYEFKLRELTAQVMSRITRAIAEVADRDGVDWVYSTNDVLLHPLAVDERNAIVREVFKGERPIEKRQRDITEEVIARLGELNHGQTQK